jgi:ATP adenylyltransferase
MVIPTRHVEKFQDLKENERNRLFEVVFRCQNMLQDLFHPTGFNVGFNQGKYSGASIKHFHVHIVPRYQSELGFIDIVAKTKIILESVDIVKDKIFPKISQYINQEKSKS